MTAYAAFRNPTEVDDDDVDDFDDEGDDDADDDDVDDDIDVEYGKGEKEKDNHCITVCERDDICNVCGEKNVISESVIVSGCSVMFVIAVNIYIIDCAGVVGLGESYMFVCINCV